MEILDGRRRDEPGAEGPDRGLVQEQPPVFCALGGKVTPYEEDKEVLAGLTAIATPGHSVGHASFVLSSGASSVFIQGDVAHIPVLFVANPGWHASIDQDPGHGRSHAPKGLRHARGRKDAGSGLPLPIPRSRPRRKDRERLSRSPDAVESQHLVSLENDSCFNELGTGT